MRMPARTPRAAARRPALRTRRPSGLGAHGAGLRRQGKPPHRTTRARADAAPTRIASGGAPRPLGGAGRWWRRRRGIFFLGALERSSPSADQPMSIGLPCCTLGLLRGPPTCQASPLIIPGFLRAHPSGFLSFFFSKKKGPSIGPDRHRVTGSQSQTNLSLAHASKANLEKKK